ncbi:MAG: ferritin [Lentisphaerota bacterium]
MNPKIEKALNDQINFELYSSYIYMAMASYFRSLSLSGFAHWMEIQVQEELAHALKLYNYITERGGIAVFDAIAKPPQTWDSPTDVFKHSHEHEQIVTSRMHEIVDLSLKEKDHTTNAHIQWYLNEQVEEESKVLGIYQQLKFANNSPQALLMFDRELAQRIFVDPNAPNAQKQP